jgi:hypothetical protein
MACWMTPLRAVAQGMLAGVVGTAAMDLLWFYRYERGGGSSGLLKWEYDAHTLADDLSAHLVYGLVTATTFKIEKAGRRLCP